MPDFKKYVELLDKIDLCDNEYYNNDKKIISDEEYDGLKDQLKEAYSYVAIHSSGEAMNLSRRIEQTMKRVGAPPPTNGSWPKVHHSYNMSSLNKCNLPSELSDWWVKCGKGKLFIIDKLDGISISLKYDNGVLVEAATRGSGDIGENITCNVSRMQNVPHKLNSEFTGYIRGEIVLYKSDWKEHLPDIANTRNGASGIAKRIDGKDCEHLAVMCYSIEGKDFTTEEDAIGAILDLGFSTPNYSVVETASDAAKVWQEYMDSTRDTLDYDIDGLVIRINDRAKQFALGGEDRPKGAIAFKFEAPEARTTVRNIICQVGDTGRITPVAEFDEIELVGAKITRATLHNFSNVFGLGIDIGSEILVKRANDVIPFISEVVKSTDTVFQMPRTCPDCGFDLVRKGEYLVCTNKETCPKQVLGRLNKWVSELGIMEWGEAVLQKLIDAALVDDVADMYRLKASDIECLERMGKKSAKNLIDELDKYRTIPLENFLGGLNIDGIATSTSKSVIDAGYDTLNKIRKMTAAQFINIPGFGTVRSINFYQGLIDNSDRIDDLLAAGVKIKEKVMGALTGKSVVFTGSAETPRKVLQKMVEDAGGVVKGSVSKGVDFLVIADVNSTSSKAQAARKLGTKLISEQQFIDMVK